MYIQNTLNHTLVLKAGYLKLAAGATNVNPLTEDDYKDTTIADAISRGWAKKVTEAIAAAEVAPVAVTVASSKGGLTLEELKAEQAAKVEKPTAFTTELGLSDGIPQGGAVGSTIGVPIETYVTEPVVAPVEEVKETKASKAKSK
jgi:hypothetical protein